LRSRESPRIPGPARPSGAPPHPGRDPVQTASLCATFVQHRRTRARDWPSDGGPAIRSKVVQSKGIMEWEPWSWMRRRGRRSLATWAHSSLAVLACPLAPPVIDGVLAVPSFQELAAFLRDYAASWSGALSKSCKHLSSPKRGTLRALSMHHRMPAGRQNSTATRASLGAVFLAMALHILAQRSRLSGLVAALQRGTKQYAAILPQP